MEIMQLKREINSENMIKKFEDVNGSQLNFKKEAGFALQAFERNNYLLKADKMSILSAIYNVGLTGLTLNPNLSQAYLVPRKLKGKLLCVLDISYQGYISKMIDTGQATDVYAHVVYKGDDFDMDLGTNKELRHKPYFLLGNEKGQEIGAYAVAVLPDGNKKFEFIPMERLLAVMEMSESYKSDVKNKTKYSPWSGAFREDMIKKTAIRYLWKYMPKNTKTSEAVAVLENLDNQVNPVDFGAEIRKEQAAATSRALIDQAVEDVPVEVIEEPKLKTRKKKESPSEVTAEPLEANFGWADEYDSEERPFKLKKQVFEEMLQLGIDESNFAQVVVDKGLDVFNRFEPTTLESFCEKANAEELNQLAN